MSTSQNYYNKTFNNGYDQYNACVGENGSQGFYSYWHGYAQAVLVMFKSLVNNESPLDHVIYPLVFCARHMVELFLKEHLTQLKEIRQTPPNLQLTEDKLSATHDLNKLWDLYVRHTLTEDDLQIYLSIQYEMNIEHQMRKSTMFIIGEDAHHIKRLHDEISDETIRTLHAIYEVGNLQCMSEDFDNLLQRIRSYNHISHSREKILGTIDPIWFIKDGLSRLGQFDMLRLIEEFYGEKKEN